MMFSAIAISYFVKKDYEQDAYSEFSDFYESVRTRLGEVSDTLHKSANSLSEQDIIISTANFITSYSDINNYQPLVFDEEKKKISSRLYQFARTTEADHVRLYDNNGWLISFADSKPEHNKQGYLSFDNGEPVLVIKSLADEGGWQRLDGNYPDNIAIKFLRNDLFKIVRYATEEEHVGAEVFYPVYRTLPDSSKKKVGTIVAITHLSNKFMDSLVVKSGYQHALILKNRVSVGDYIEAIDSLDFNLVPDLFSENDKTGLFDDKNYYISAYSLPLNDDEKFYFVSSMNKTVIEEDVVRKLSIIFKVFLLSAIVVLLIGLFFARKGISEPLDRLIGTTRQIKFGNYDPDISYAKENEFGELAKTLVRMARTINIRELDIRAAQEMLETRVEERTNELGKANELLKKEIDERKQVEQELFIAKEQAENSSKAKSEFLSKMSHELRTPLNAILGFSQLLQHDKSEPLTNNQEDNVYEILRAGNHLLDLINEVLDLARIESGRMALNTEEVNLVDSINDSVQLVASNGDKKGIHIKVEFADKDVKVNADPMRLKQVLLNLLSNAIKYNKQGGEIKISSSINEQGYAEVSVSDTGIGISAKNLSRLFVPFDRLEQDDNYQEGTGIGLVISRDLIRLMGGELSVESQEGTGTTFTFTLPLV